MCVHMCVGATYCCCCTVVLIFIPSRYRSQVKQGKRQGKNRGTTNNNTTTPQQESTTTTQPAPLAEASSSEASPVADEDPLSPANLWQGRTSGLVYYVDDGDDLWCSSSSCGACVTHCCCCLGGAVVLVDGVTRCCYPYTACCVCG